jgi:hypothetical protein
MAKDRPKRKKWAAAAAEVGPAPAPAPAAEPDLAPQPTLPKTRESLLALHRETRARRNAALHGSAEHRAAIDLIGRIEIEVARIERAMDPPRG